MQSNTNRNYGSEVKGLEDETTRGSELELALQEKRAMAAVEEITQSITSMAQENDLIEVENDKNLTGNAIVDPSKLSDKIAEFEKFVELLKLTHLEQDTLDFFLRYTISSAELLRLKSTQDSKYLDLENEVKQLERGISEDLQRDIDNTKLMILSGTEELAKDQDKVNEEFLATTEVLEECEQLIGELERAREEKKIRSAQEKSENASYDKLYKEGDILRKYYGDLEVLQERIQQLESLKLEHEVDREDKHVQLDPASNKVGSALESLINLWEAKLLPGSGWNNLEVYPQSKKFQFDVSRRYTVVIALDDLNAIKDVLLYVKEGSGIKLEEEMQLELRQHHVGSADIYKSMEEIIDRLNGHPTPGIST